MEEDMFGLTHPLVAALRLSFSGADLVCPCWSVGDGITPTSGLFVVS
jgi:hypothetical protein